MDMEYGESVVQNDVYYIEDAYFAYNDEPAHWIFKYKIDYWIKNPPQLIDLLARTINIPLILSLALLLPILIVGLVERDYNPNKSILTILRLPRPRSRYLLAKLIPPTILMFLFWGIQYSVILLQTICYFSAVPEAVRPDSQSPWAFDYYRILYPVTQPIWFPAIICALCMAPLIIITITLVVKGGLKSWIYLILPAVSVFGIVLMVNRVSYMWWAMPILLMAIYINGKILLNKGQIVQ